MRCPVARPSIVRIKHVLNICTCSVKYICVILFIYVIHAQHVFKQMSMLPQTLKTKRAGRVEAVFQVKEKMEPLHNRLTLSVQILNIDNKILE